MTIIIIITITIIIFIIIIFIIIIIIVIITIIIIILFRSVFLSCVYAFKFTDIWWLSLQKRYVKLHNVKL